MPGESHTKSTCIEGAKLTDRQGARAIAKDLKLVAHIQKEQQKTLTDILTEAGVKYLMIGELSKAPVPVHQPAPQVAKPRPQTATVAPTK